VNINCPYCSKEIPSDAIFCLFCGKKLPSADTSLSRGEKIRIYAVAVILCPLGLYWFFKYFRSKDAAKRKTAYYALFITVVVIIALYLVSFYYVKVLSNYTNLYKTDLEQYNSLGL